MWLKGSLLVLALAAPLFLFATLTGCTYTAPLPAADSNSYECACTCNPELSHHFDRRVSANEDDSEQQLNDAILLNSDDLDFLNGRVVGLRFRNVPLPPRGGNRKRQRAVHRCGRLQRGHAHRRDRR